MPTTTGEPAPLPFRCTLCSLLRGLSRVLGPAAIRQRRSGRELPAFLLAARAHRPAAADDPSAAAELALVRRLVLTRADRALARVVEEWLAALASREQALAVTGLLRRRLRALNRGGRLGLLPAGLRLLLGLRLLALRRLLVVLRRGRQLDGSGLLRHRVALLRLLRLGLDLRLLGRGGLRLLRRLGLRLLLHHRLALCFGRLAADRLRQPVVHIARERGERLEPLLERGPLLALALGGVVRRGEQLARPADAALEVGQLGRLGLHHRLVVRTGPLERLACGGDLVEPVLQRLLEPPLALGHLVLLRVDLRTGALELRERLRAPVRLGPKLLADRFERAAGFLQLAAATVEFGARARLVGASAALRLDQLGHTLLQLAATRLGALDLAVELLDAALEPRDPITGLLGLRGRLLQLRRALVERLACVRVGLRQPLQPLLGVGQLLRRGRGLGLRLCAGPLGLLEGLARLADLG